MQFSDVLKRLKEPDIELDQVGRLTVGNDSTIMIGRPKDLIYPFQFQYHSLYAPAGADDFDLDDEEIDALLRRFRITRKQFDKT